MLLLPPGPVEPPATTPNAFPIAEPKVEPVALIAASCPSWTHYQSID